MNSQAPSAKIETIERSLRCFAYALWSLLPVVGIGFAILALANYFRVRHRPGTFWNPAERYLKWGRNCAWATLGLWVLAVSLVFMIILYGEIKNP